MTEAAYTTTFRLPQQDAPQLTVRADDPEQFVELLQAVPELAAAIQVAFDEYRGVLNVAEVLGGKVLSTGPDVQADPRTGTNQAGQSASSSGALSGQAVAANGSDPNLLFDGQHVIKTDTKYGTKVAEFNHPQAPSTVRGPKVLLTQKAQSGNFYTQWVDPSDTFAWYPRPKVDLAERKNAREWANDVEFDHTPYLG